MSLVGLALFNTVLVSLVGTVVWYGGTGTSTGSVQLYSYSVPYTSARPVRDRTGIGAGDVYNYTHEFSVIII